MANPNDASPATDKPVSPAIAAADPKAPATAITSDTIDIKGKKTYTVAPGRTVSHGSPPPKGSPEGTAGPVKHIPAGETVDLDEADALRLIDLGFLLGPDGSIIIHPDGPATDVENGVQITQDNPGGVQISQGR